MAPEDRDRSFDKAIARQFRSAAASSDSSKQAAGTPSLHDACPDTETLAAYHERSLLPEELNAWKEHIVGCPHCQELLAHLELTDDILLDAAEEVEVLATAEAQHAQEIAPASGPAARREQRHATHLTRGVRWRWIAPAGAIAAGLLVWIALHEHEPPFRNSNEIQVAKNQEPAASPAPRSAPVSADSGDVQQSPAKPPGAADAVSPNSKLLPSKDLSKQGSELRARGALAPPSLGKEEGGRKDRERQANGDLLFRDEKKADLDDKSVGGAIPQKTPEQKKESETSANAEVLTPAQEQNLQVQNQNVSRALPGPAPLGQTRNLAKAKPAAAPEPPTAPAANGVSNFEVDAMSETVMVSDGRRLVAAPGSTLVWRPGRAGLIEFTRDGGRSWMRQPSGVLVDLLGGSATSESVCWIIGRAGAVLLTTDGGAHWKLLSSPLKEDLGGIRPMDATHATIWNARGTKYFATSDGGLTWQPAVHP